MLEILLISAGAVLETLFIMRSYKRRDVSSVVLKTAASVVFVNRRRRSYCTSALPEVL